MNRATVSFVIAIATTLSACDGFVGEIGLGKPEGPAIPIVQPDYVVLRAVTQESAPGLIAATAFGRTVYFPATERVLDLRHFDPRTARVDTGPNGTHVVFIGTTSEGDQLLGAWTEANLERQLGVFVDGRLISAPVIKSKITGGIILDGEFSKAEAEAVVARLLRGGAAV